MNYYVYTLAYPDGTVFYVGKGSGNRIQHHEQEALRGHDCPKCDLIRSIWQQGGTVQRAIVFETDDERVALAYEADLIQSYHAEQLVNRRGIWIRRPAALPRPIVPSNSAFTELINHLFQTHRRPDGKEYSLHEVAAQLNGQLSPGYLAKLRNGTSTNPSRQSLLLLCQFFRVPATYFFPELDDLTAEEPSEDERISIALRSSSLPEDVQSHIQGLIKAIRKQQDKQE